MRSGQNSGTDRVIDVLRPLLAQGNHLDAISPSLSLFAFAELAAELATSQGCRFVLPRDEEALDLLGKEADRAARNRLQTRWLAKRLIQWIESKSEVRNATGPIPQGTFVLRDGGTTPTNVLLGSLSFSTEGLGLAPGNENEDSG